MSVVSRVRSENLRNALHRGIEPGQDIQHLFEYQSAQQPKKGNENPPQRERFQVAQRDLRRGPISIIENEYIGQPEYLKLEA